MCLCVRVSIDNRTHTTQMNKMNDNNNKVKEMIIIIRAEEENSILSGTLHMEKNAQSTEQTGTGTM